ncbi:uncharacterized protein [Watersipora subatra]|uniref:uncharacterized protein n=1 Tax=Watersipora subatra TaxID=2589382 RepID=UPI00355B9067
MGDPTDRNKGEESNDIHQHFNADSPLNSDNEDNEAEQVQPAVEQSSSVQQSSSQQRVPRNSSQTSENSDTVHSILSSITNQNAAVVIPVDGGAGDGEESIDAERMEKFYTGALSAITKMRRQTVKTETKIDNLRQEVSHERMQAWTDEHFESLQKAPGSK